jgi:hypothetical protein
LTIRMTKRLTQRKQAVSAAVMGSQRVRVVVSQTTSKRGNVQWSGVPNHRSTGVWKIDGWLWG